MTKLFTLITVVFLSFSTIVSAQSIILGGRCFPANSNVPINGTVNGRNGYFESIVNNGFADIAVQFNAIDNRWEILLDGQPFFYAPDNGFNAPPSNSPEVWQGIEPDATNDCPGTTLSVTGNTALPVEIVSFKGNPKNKTVFLKWEVASEKNLKGYEIEKRNGKNWQKIGEVNAENNSNYYFTDDNPTFSTVNYYRLKSVDNDDSYKYSDIVSVDMNQVNVTKPVLFPNPMNNMLNISFNNITNLQLQIIDFRGTIILSKNVKSNEVIDLSNLSTGIYIVNMLSDLNTWNEKIVKY